MSARSIRAELATDDNLGVGNVLTELVHRGVGLDEPTLTFDTVVDGHPAWQALTLRQLHERVAARAATLHAAGIGPRDPVAVFVGSAADQVLCYLALSRLGAIPALMNGRLDGETAARFISRLGAAAVLADAAHGSLLEGHDLGGPVVHDVAALGAGDPATAPDQFRHHSGDPAVITHSSGTTGLPKAVAHSHASLFASVRHRLTLPKAQALSRFLGALPAAHAATVIAVNLALCNRSEMLVISQQSADAVLEAIERWHPTGVLGFAATWSELAAEDLSGRDLASVGLWWNTGDCAHEAHIRRLVALGSREVAGRDGTRRVPGSQFIDGLGSTEMGHSQFFITHTPDTERYGRCIGRKHAFSDVVVFDEEGNTLGPGQVGQLGVQAPTVALGYWNDSVTTWRTRLSGYFLTGDLVSYDEDGYFYHVDRMVDSVDLGGGRRLFTAKAEEQLLAALPDILECTVVALPGDDGTAVAHVLLVPAPGADVTADRHAQVRAALDDHVAAAVRDVVAVAPDQLPLGPTGKVRKVLLRQRYLDGEILGEQVPHPSAGAAGA
ncbi:class I adenylate-forming enzyme family protein [Streptomyces sp. NPDC047000]|uniref:class I adenylate-forming enzyme family protein n=1 Tax=Streptomyces sp. NPDC047000 TaxID=3155474 RepID=UPI0033DC48C4